MSEPLTNNSNLYSAGAGSWSLRESWLPRLAHLLTSIQAKAQWSQDSWIENLPFVLPFTPRLSQQSQPKPGIQQSQLQPSVCYSRVNRRIIAFKPKVPPHLYWPHVGQKVTYPTETASQRFKNCLNQQGKRTATTRGVQPKQQKDAPVDQLQLHSTAFGNRHDLGCSCNKSI